MYEFGMKFACHLASVAKRIQKQVARKIRVSVFSSGNEIVEPWQKADENSIYNANALAINALLSSELCEVSYLGIIKDDLSATKEALSNSCADLLITSGGASVGDADFMDEALRDLGFLPLFDAKICPFRKNSTPALSSSPLMRHPSFCLALVAMSFSPANSASSTRKTVSAPKGIFATVIIL